MTSADGKKEWRWATLLRNLQARPWLLGAGLFLLITAFVLVGPSHHGARLYVRHHPECAIQHMHGHDVYVQPVKKPRGVLFVAHGCSHGGGDFCMPSKACPECLGLPEELGIAQHAARRSFALVTISSRDRVGSKCWSVQHDLEAVGSILKEIMEQYQWTRVPLYAMGASSGMRDVNREMFFIGALPLLCYKRPGGSFILHLPTASNVPHISGLCSQIMGIPPASMQDVVASTASIVPHANPKTPAPSYPATIFVHMPRDEHTAALVDADIHTLRSLGIRATAFPVLPKPIAPTFFSERIANITPTVSKALVQALVDAKVVDRTTQLLQLDPRGWVHVWRPEMEKTAAKHGVRLALDADVSPLFEELNVAWAGHEIVSDVMDTVFRFWAV